MKINCPNNYDCDNCDLACFEDEPIQRRKGMKDVVKKKKGFAAERAFKAIIKQGRCE